MIRACIAAENRQNAMEARQRAYVILRCIMVAGIPRIVILTRLTFLINDTRMDSKSNMSGRSSAALTKPLNSRAESRQIRLQYRIVVMRIWLLSDGKLRAGDASRRKSRTNSTARSGAAWSPQRRSAAFRMNLWKSMRRPNCAGRPAP